MIKDAQIRGLFGFYREGIAFRRDRRIAEYQLRDYRARLGKPFLHDIYLAELTTLRDRLKTGLAGATHEPGPVPSIPLAEPLRWESRGW